MKRLVWMLSCAAFAAPTMGCAGDDGDIPGSPNRGRPDESGNVVVPEEPVVLSGKIGRPQPTTFGVRIENVSAGSSLETAISRGVWVTHRDDNPLFEEGQPD